MLIQVAITYAEQSWIAPAFLSKVSWPLQALNSVWTYFRGKPAFAGGIIVAFTVRDSLTGELLFAGIGRRVSGQQLIEKKCSIPGVMSGTTWSFGRSRRPINSAWHGEERVALSRKRKSQIDVVTRGVAPLNCPREITGGVYPLTPITIMRDEPATHPKCVPKTTESPERFIPSHQLLAVQSGKAKRTLEGFIRAHQIRYCDEERAAGASGVWNRGPELNGRPRVYERGEYILSKAR